MWFVQNAVHSEDVLTRIFTVAGKVVAASLGAKLLILQEGSADEKFERVAVCLLGSLSWKEHFLWGNLSKMDNPIRF